MNNTTKPNGYALHCGAFTRAAGPHLCAVCTPTGVKRSTVCGVRTHNRDPQR